MGRVEEVGNAQAGCGKLNGASNIQTAQYQAMTEFEAEEPEGETLASCDAGKRAAYHHPWLRNTRRWHGKERKGKKERQLTPQLLHPHPEQVPLQPPQVVHSHGDISSSLRGGSGAF